ncbi:MAG: discoidin domain-containing protein [Planctomycetota bacterium]
MEEDGKVSLAGTWKVALDPNDEGPSVLRRKTNDPTKAGSVWLPGSIQAQGYGDLPTAQSPWIGDQRYPKWADRLYAPYREDDNFKMPYWLTPDRVYVGQAWFEREVQIPDAWSGKDIELFLERTHWVTEAWLGDKRLGQRDSLIAPHIYSLNGFKPGTHTLRLRVDNRMHINVGPNAHSMSDHTQGNWNGVIGKIEMRAQPVVHVDRVRIDTDIRDKTATVRMFIENTSRQEADIMVKLKAELDGKTAAEKVLTLEGLPTNKMTEHVVTLELGEDAKLWDEFNPNIYNLTVKVVSEQGRDYYHDSFGLREIKAEGTRLLLNGRPIFLRGTLDCLIYPLTGYPPMDVPSWERVFTQIKAFGLNHVRYHSWCPPRAAFEAADRIGVYLQGEGPFWANQGTQLGLGDPIDQYVYAENDRVLDTYGNHPSFILMAYGNEPRGPNKNGSRGLGQRFLGPWLEHVQAKDDRRLYTSGAGWPVMEENQFHNIMGPRIQQWGQALNSIINGQPPQTVADHSAVIQRYAGTPIVAHEIGQWCAYPDFSEMQKYTGLLRPKNFDIFQKLLHDNGLGHREKDFLMASGALQLLCYKAEIEMALRTPNFGGFQLLDLHDFPGQGTALVGVLDPFWDPKPYVTAEMYRAFCAPTVPLARMERRVFKSGESLTAELDISHFGREDAKSTSVRWSLISESQEILAEGLLTADLPVGELTNVGRIDVALETERAMRATLNVQIDALDAHNTWQIWVYPADVTADVPDDVHVTQVLDDAAEDKLAQGQTVLLLANPDRVMGGVVMGFSSPFWNYAWTDGQPPHTLGILVDPEHEAFNAFPTDIHTDWQWWELVSRGGAMLIDDLPRSLEPIVEPIDTWFRARRLAALFEARVGKGKLVVCTLDLTNDLENRYAARQFRHSLMKYLGSDAFDPQTEVKTSQVRALFRAPSLAERMGITLYGSSAHGSFEAGKAFDDDPSTFWHTDFSGNIMKPHPHHLTLEFSELTKLKGMGYTARINNGNGRIGRYAIHISNDGKDWGEPIVTGRFNAGKREQVVSFDRIISTRFIRLVALDCLNGTSHSAVAEWRPIMP